MCDHILENLPCMHTLEACKNGAILHKKPLMYVKDALNYQ